MPKYDITALRRALDNVEHDDAESHKLYNNLGHAYFADRRYRLSLKAHREEKRACKRLLAARATPERSLDLAIAYRRCGDVMLKLDRLVDARNRVIDARADVVRAANEQHRKGLDIAQQVRGGGVARRVEAQAACAAVAQSALALAMETKDRGHFDAAAFGCVEAAMLAESLPVGKGGVEGPVKEAMLLGVSTNMAIALSGLGMRDKGKAILHAIAVRAKKAGDEHNLVRAVANLAEEASEDEDWELCETYTREWVRLARKQGDAQDEADALRKLASVLAEKKMFEEAREMLQRSLVHAGTRVAKEEALHFLNLVEQELEDRKKEKDVMERGIVEADGFQREGNFVGEAKARLMAGNAAFRLGLWEDVERLLGRYFELVDEFGCDTGVTGVKQEVHNTAVANVGEAMWSMKRYEEAVKWASRELTLFSDDIPGQAQAWCNLGVYLDDYGKRENAIEALKKSVELAKQVGEEDVCKRAQNNLELIRAELDGTGDGDGEGEQAENDEQNEQGEQIEQVEQEREGPRGEPDPVVMDVDVVEEVEGGLAQQSNEQQRQEANRGGEVEADVPPNTRRELLQQQAELDLNGERSVIIDSSQPMRAGPAMPTGPSSAHSQGVSSRRSRRERTSLPANWITQGTRVSAEQSRSQHSRGTTGGNSSAGVNKFFDLASEYKRVCSRRMYPTLPCRPMVVSALRSLSSVLLAREAVDDATLVLDKLDLSALFLSNDDVGAIFETLGILSDEQRVFVDMRLNPMVTAAAYECVNPRSFGAARRLHAVRKVDFSCAGVTPKALLVLGDALSADGALANVGHVSVSKNGLGKQGKATASGVARVLLRARQVEVVDLSLNLLSNTFMRDLVEALDAGRGAGEGAGEGAGVGSSGSGVRVLDLHLNNREAPTALLDGEGADAMVGWFRRLFDVMPGLESVDVRACGGGSAVRRGLRELADGFGAMGRNIVTVSAAVHDDLGGGRGAGVTGGGGGDDGGVASGVLRGGL